MATNKQQQQERLNDLALELRKRNHLDYMIRSLLDYYMGYTIEVWNLSIETAMSKIKYYGEK